MPTTRAAPEWIQSVKTALATSAPGWIQVADACPEALGELVEALVGEHPELEVHTDARRLPDMPPERPGVLVLREEDIDGLRTRLGPRGVLFCDARTTRVLAGRGETFEGRVTCPPRPAAFAVRSLRQALAVRAPGLVWTGGDLAATFATARPRGRLRVISAARSYEDLVGELRAHPREWTAWTDVDSAARLRRVRWVHAEVGHRTRALLVEPALACPGWWPIHARPIDVRTARERLEQKGAELPGQVAALNHLEPESIALAEEFLWHGLDAPTAESAIAFMAAPEGPADPTLRETFALHGRRILRGTSEPPIFRVFRPADLRRHLRAELEGITQTLRAGGAVEPEDVASWTAWARVLPIGEDVEPLVATVAEQSLELATELWLAQGDDHSEGWDRLASWALELGDPEAAVHWARRARDPR